MDWFSWLSKTGVEPVLVYEYSLAFAHNELDEEDLAYFNHEFLQSMGITIAKHRLEILKLARKYQKQSSYPVSKLIFAIKNTKRSLGRYFRTLIHRNRNGNDDNRALVLVSAPQSRRSHNSSRWKRELLSRSRSSGRHLVVVRKQNYNHKKAEKVMMLTDGSVGGSEYPAAMVVSTPRLNSFSSPLVVDEQNNNRLTDDDDDGYGDDLYGYDDGEQHWTPVVEEIRWDAMFQDLKPT